MRLHLLPVTTVIALAATGASYGHQALAKSVALGQAPPRTRSQIPPAALEPDGWVEGKLQAMTLRQKIGQMFMVDLDASLMNAEVAAHLTDGCYGSVIFFDRNIQGEDQTRVFINQLQTQAKVQVGIPLLVAVDQEGGKVSRLRPLFKEFMDLTTRLSARLIGRLYAYAPKRASSVYGQLAGTMAARMQDLGFNMNLAPVLDLTGDQKSFIYDRSFGDDPEKVSQITTAFADAMQSHGIIATGKHFPSLSDTTVDSHRALPVLDRPLAQLEAHEFVPFRRLKPHVGAMMVGHIMVPALDRKHPASISTPTIQALRRDIGWNGVVITDDLKMKALASNYSLTEILIRAVYADVDILLLAAGAAEQHAAVDILQRAVERGKISPARIDASVRRILQLKRRYAE